MSEHENLEDESDEATPAEPVQLSDAQRARIERNRQKALLLRNSRLASKPYTTDNSSRLVS